jgi:hypothetical protein
MLTQGASRTLFNRTVGHEEFNNLILEAREVRLPAIRACELGPSVHAKTGDWIIAVDNVMIEKEESAKVDTQESTNASTRAGHKERVLLRYRSAALSAPATGFFRIKARKCFDELIIDREEKAIVEQLAQRGVSMWSEYLLPNPLQQDAAKAYDTVHFLNCLIRSCAAFEDLGALDALNLKAQLNESSFVHVGIRPPEQGDVYASEVP